MTEVKSLQKFILVVSVAGTQSQCLLGVGKGTEMLGNWMLGPIPRFWWVQSISLDGLTKPCDRALVLTEFFFALYWWLDWYGIVNYLVSLCRISKFIQEKSQNSVLVSLLLPFLYQSNMEQVGRNYLPSLLNICFSFNKVYLFKVWLKILLITCHFSWLARNQVFMYL